MLILCFVAVSCSLVMPGIWTSGPWTWRVRFNAPLAGTSAKTLADDALVSRGAAGNAGVSGALEPGVDIVFLEPLEAISGRVAVRFRQAPGEGDAKETTASVRVLHAPEVYRMVVAYQRARALADEPPSPMYVVWSDHRGSSFTTKQPLVVMEGEEQARVISAPAVFLSRSEREGLSGPRPQPALDVACHEMGHALMLVTHGVLGYPYGAGEYLRQAMDEPGHWLSKITNPQYAFSEGWAELCAEYAGGGLASNRFFFRDVDNKHGLLRAGSMESREGAVCNILLRALESGDRDALFREYLATLSEDHPKTMGEFFSALLPRLTPAARRRARDAVLRFTKQRYDIENPPDAPNLLDQARDAAGLLAQRLAQRLLER